MAEGFPPIQLWTFVLLPGPWWSNHSDPEACAGTAEVRFQLDFIPNEGRRESKDSGSELGWGGASGQGSGSGWGRGWHGVTLSVAHPPTHPRMTEHHELGELLRTAGGKD